MEGLTLQNGHSTTDRGLERCRITETTMEKPITCLDSHEQALIAKFQKMMDNSNDGGDGVDGDYFEEHM